MLCSVYLIWTDHPAITVPDLEESWWNFVFQEREVEQIASKLCGLWHGGGYVPKPVDLCSMLQSTGWLASDHFRQSDVNSSRKVRRKGGKEVCQMSLLNLPFRHIPYFDDTSAQRLVRRGNTLLSGFFWLAALKDHTYKLASICLPGGANKMLEVWSADRMDDSGESFDMFKS